MKSKLNNSKERVVEKSQKDSGNKKEIKKVFCRDCKFYNKNSEREFWRKRGPIDPKTGQRTKIMGVRGICVSKVVNAGGHLVKMDRPRQCVGYEKGTYKKVKEKKKESNEEKTAPSEYHGPPLTEVERKDVVENLNNAVKRLGKTFTATNVVSGQRKTLKRKGKHVVVVSPR